MPKQHILDHVEGRMNDLRDAVRSAIAFSAMATETDDVMTLGELLRNERGRLGLSLQKVADAAGMTKGHVWELENGRSRNPTIKAVYGLSCALGVPFIAVCRCALKEGSAP